MRILLTAMNMTYYSGQATSVYELGRAIPFEHDVTVCAPFGNNELLKGLMKAGVKCLNPQQLEPRYDLIIASSWRPEGIEGLCINMCHSELDVEPPIPADFYIAVRPTTRAWMIEKHGIPAEKIAVIYNGIDRVRFAPVEKKPERDYWQVVVACTLDKLREKFLNHIIEGATEKRRVDIYGLNFGAELKYSPWVRFHDATWRIEKHLAEADEVCGILLGRINMEARSCGVVSTMYDPVTLEKTDFGLTDQEFDDRHNIVKVIHQILSLPIIETIYG